MTERLLRAIKLHTGLLKKRGWHETAVTLRSKKARLREKIAHIKANDPEVARYHGLLEKLKERGTYRQFGLAARELRAKLREKYGEAFEYL